MKIREANDADRKPGGRRAWSWYWQKISHSTQGNSIRFENRRVSVSLVGHNPNNRRWPSVMRRTGDLAPCVFLMLLSEEDNAGSDLRKG
jgi:hypothetical protein